MNRFVYVLWAVSFLMFGCNSVVRKEAKGLTQGTTYKVIYYGSDLDLQYEIDSLLLSFDRVLSTYQEDSYISKWNRNEVERVAQPVMFWQVVRRAKAIHKETNGAFDITVSPLMKYWFERDWSVSQLDSSVVDSIMGSVGMKYVIELKGDEFKKTIPTVQLDVNAIAQGYSVDVLAAYLETRGIADYLVEIGGEVCASGSKPKQQPWKIGIDRPKEEGSKRELALSLELKDKAMATSGNYRKFVEINGQKFGHTLDPRIGYPATTDVLSATVIASDCMTADALATACMVMGFEKAKLLIEETPELQAVLIYTDLEGVHTWISIGLNQ